MCIIARILCGVMSKPAAEISQEEIIAAENKKSVFERRWEWNREHKLRPLLRKLLTPPLRGLVKINITGLELVPPSGPLLVMINHIHAFDPALPMCMIDRDITPLPKVELFESLWTRWLSVGYGAIPVHRGAVDKQAIRSSCEVLEGGGAIIISPEGTRSPTGALIRAHNGMAFIVARAKVPVMILPVALLDSDKLDFAQWLRLRRPEVNIRIGEPFKLDFGPGPRPDLDRATEDAMYRLAALLPVEMRGAYA